MVVWLERVGRALGYEKSGVLYMSMFADNALLGDQHSLDRYRQGVFLHTHEYNMHMNITYTYVE